MAPLPQLAVACGDLSFKTPWVRQPPPTSRVAAGYVNIHNPSEKEIQVVDVRSTCCKNIMIHETTFEQGVSKMRHVDSIDIVPQDEVNLAPHGMHLMLINPIKTLSLNQLVDITFVCDDGSDISVSFPVQKEQPKS